MAREVCLKSKSKVVPFDQNGQFYYKKAKKYMENNNYINALSFYRKAVEKDPENLDYRVDLAEVFTEMGYYEVSSQILFSVLQKDESKANCYFSWDVITWDCRIMRKPRSVLKGIFLWSRTVYTRMKRVNCVTFLKARNFMLKLK